jgi:integrase/recombinase XerC
VSPLTELRARVVLAEAQALGVGLADLVAAAGTLPPPSLGEVIDTLAPAFTRATVATYRPYWRLAVELHGTAPITSLTVGHLQEVVDAAADRAQQRRSTSTGRASRETTGAALRAVFGRATAAGIVATNPAALLAKPRRPASRRRALTDSEVLELIDAVCSVSRDPDLDLLLVRFHLETGARRQGALGLRVRDLDEHRATVWLHEKGDTDREQPVSPSLVRQLTRHAARRGGLRQDDAVLRTADGWPMTARRYDTLFGRARAVLPWSARTPLSAHVLRHTAVTAIGRIGGYPVAQAFAGHAAPTVTGRYLHATIAEVAAAVAVMTSEAHPLAPASPRSMRCSRR